MCDLFKSIKFNSKLVLSLIFNVDVMILLHYKYNFLEIVPLLLQVSL